MIYRIPPDVVRAGHDVKVGGAIGTVSGGQDVVLRDEGTATEPGVVNEEGHLPGPLVGGSLESSDDLGSGSLNTALLGEVVGGGLVGGLADLAGLEGPHDLDIGVLGGAGLGVHQSMSGRVLGEVPGGGRPPVLLGPQTAAVGHSLNVWRILTFELADFLI